MDLSPNEALLSIDLNTADRRCYRWDTDDDDDAAAAADDDDNGFFCKRKMPRGESYSAERAAKKPQARDVQQADKHRWQDTITLVQAFS